MEKPSSEHQTLNISSAPLSIAGELEKPTSEHQTPDISSAPPSIAGELEKPTSEHQTSDIEIEKPTSEHQTPDVSSDPLSIDVELEKPTSEQQTPDISSVPPSIAGDLEKPTSEHQTPDVSSVPTSTDVEIEKPTSEHQTPDISSATPTIVGELVKPTSEQQTPDISSAPPSMVGEVHQDPAVVTEVHKQQHPEAEQKTEMSEEEVKSTLEKIAYTGLFWHDWEKLKVALSCWLKKVLSEYPEAKMTDELQKVALGESYSELVRRLDEALLSFDEGPPFTLQRLCEILVAARSIYPKLSKLALALEKNLLVTSMLSISTEAEVQLVADAKAASESTKMEAETTEDIKTAAAANEDTEREAGNGIGALEGDTDEIMTDVVEEAAEVDDDAMTIDTETSAEPSEETMTTTKTESETATEIIDEEPSSDPMAADEGDLPLP